MANNKIKLTPIKKVCSLTKDIARYGGYVHVCVDVTTGRVLTNYYFDINTYCLYDDKNIVYVDSFYAPMSMEEIRYTLVARLEFLGYSYFC